MSIELPQFGDVRTGIPIVDDQHRELLSLMGNLHDLLVSPGTGDDVQVFLMAREALLRYIGEHFACEERLMRCHGLDVRHVLLHMREHERFTHRAYMVALSHGDDFCVDDTRQLLEFLIHWWHSHLPTDRSMARQIAAVLAGSQASDAYDDDFSRFTLEAKRQS